MSHKLHETTRTLRPGGLGTRMYTLEATPAQPFVFYCNGALHKNTCATRSGKWWLCCTPSKKHEASLCQPITRTHVVVASHGKQECICIHNWNICIYWSWTPCLNVSCQCLLNDKTEPMPSKQTLATNANHCKRMRPMQTNAKNCKHMEVIANELVKREPMQPMLNTRNSKSILVGGVAHTHRGSNRSPYARMPWRITGLEHNIQTVSNPRTWCMDSNTGTHHYVYACTSLK